MNASIEEGKDLMIRMFAKELRAQNPSWTIARSLSVALEQHPDLAESREELTPTDKPAFATSSGYRYDPEKKHTAPKGTSWDDVLALMKKYAKERVEAVKPKEDNREVMLVYGSNGEVVDLELR